MSAERPELGGRGGRSGLLGWVVVALLAVAAAWVVVRSEPRRAPTAAPTVRVVMVTATPHVQVVVVTASATPTPGPTHTPTRRPTRTPTFTPSRTPTATPTTVLPLEPRPVGTLGQGAILDVARSPDGRRVAVLHDHWLRWYDTATYTEQGAVDLVDEFNQVELNPGGQLAVVHGGLGLRLVDLVEGHIIFEEDNPNGFYSGFVFSADSRWLVLQEAHTFSRGGYNVITRIDLEAGARAEEFPAAQADENPWFSVPSLSPNGQWVAAGRTDRRVYVWDLVTGDQRFALEGHAGNVSSVSFSPGSQLLASGSEDGTVRLWDPAEGTLLRVITGFSTGIAHVSFQADGSGLLICPAATSGCQVWQAATGQLSPLPVDTSTPTPDPFMRELHQQGYAEAKYVSSDPVAFSPIGGEVAHGSAVVLVWAPDQAMPRLALETGGAGLVRHLAYSADGGRLAALMDNGQVLVWDTATGVQRLRAGKASRYRSPNSGLAISAEGDRVAFEEDGRVVVWEVDAGQLAAQVPSPTSGGSVQMAFGAEGQALYVLWNAATMQVWDLATNTRLRQVDLPTADPDPWAPSALHWPLVARSNQDAQGSFIELWHAESRRSLRLGTASTESETLVFSPDGRILLTRSNGRLLFWRTDTGALIHHTRLTVDFAEIAFSPDGQQLAFGRGGRVALCDVSAITAALDDPQFQPMATPTSDRVYESVPTTTQLPTVALPTVTLPVLPAGALSPANARQVKPQARFGAGTLLTAEWSPDGQQIVVAGSGGVSIYAADSLSLTAHFDPGSGVQALAALPGGAVRAAGATGEQVRAWQGSQLLANLPGSGPLALSPDGLRLAFVGEEGLQTWDLATARRLAWLHEGSANPVVFSPDGRLAAQALRDNIRVWNARTGTVTAALGGPAQPGSYLAFSVDGQRVLSPVSNTVWLWTLRPNVPAISYTVLSEAELAQWAEPPSATAAALSPDGRVLAAGFSHGAIVLLDRDSGTTLRRLAGHASGVADLRFSPDGARLLSVEADGTLAVWAVDSGTSLGQMAAHLGAVRGLQARTDGQLWAWGTQTAWLLRPTDGGLVRTTQVLSGTLLAASPAGERLVTYRPYQARLVDAQTGADLGRLPGDATEEWTFIASVRGLFSADFSADGQTLAVGGTGGVWVHIPEARRLLSRSLGGIVNVVALSPDGQHVAACTGNGAGPDCWLLNQASGEVAQTMSARKVGMHALVFAPDGRQLLGLEAVWMKPTTLLVWDAASGQLLRELVLDQAATSLVISPDGRLLALGYADGRVALLDAASLETLATLASHRGAIRALAFATDGTWLASGSDDGSVMIWAVGK